MTTIVKTPPEIPTQIVRHRKTYLGHQYTVADTYGTQIVTVNNDCVGCTCGADRSFLVCDHITVVEQQRAADAEQARRRSAYVELFGIYAR